MKRENKRQAAASHKLEQIFLVELKYEEMFLLKSGDKPMEQEQESSNPWFPVCSGNKLDTRKHPCVTGSETAVRKNVNIYCCF